ncbi:MAG: hypothetical protein Q8P20_10235 [bacterium]|nr:hypothetical protein [bacterium]
MGDAFENKSNNFWTPVLILMLFVVSAAITGSLVLGRPIYLYLNDQKKEGLLFLTYTIAWLFMLMIISFAVYITVA